MLTRAAKYLIPTVGAAAFCMPRPVLAEGNRCKPGSVYDVPPKKKDTYACSPSEEKCKENTQLERLVMKCRTDMVPLKASMGTYTENMRCQMISFYGDVKDNVCYLRTRAPQEVRIGVIVAGGLFGMMLGFRRGLMRKLFFGALGAGAASYLVYPEETKYYVSNSVPIAKKYAMIGYNFVSGEPESGCPQKPKKCGPAATLKSEKADRNLK